MNQYRKFVDMRIENWVLGGRVQLGLLDGLVRTQWISVLNKCTWVQSVKELYWLTIKVSIHNLNIGTILINWTRTSISAKVYTLGEGNFAILSSYLSWADGWQTKLQRRPRTGVWIRRLWNKTTSICNKI